MIDTSYEELLGSTSPLSNQLSGFVPRDSQQKMAVAVAIAIKEKQILIAEAGTGTGKTFAYLLPALLSQKKVIISTGTKNLQDQLFQRDLPLLLKSFGLPIKAALLKGRSNYLCHYRFERNAPESATANSQFLADYSVVLQWLNSTRDGDMTSISELTEDSPLWPVITSTADNCLGQECPRIDDCFILKARRRAQQADILVINHHLFFADFSLQQDGFGELLPQSEVIIFDEAHQLHDIASQFLGITFSSRQLMQLANDVKNETLKSARDMQGIVVNSDKLEIAVTGMRLAFGSDSMKNPWIAVSRQQSIIDAIKKLTLVLNDLQEILQLAAERSKGLENCYQRCRELTALFNHLTGKTPSDQIHWYETFKKTFVIHFTPLIIAPLFKNYLINKPRTTIFTSATLSVNKCFDHFATLMGIDGYQSLQVDSPFDYKTQALLYLPRYMPNPNDQNYNEILLESVLPLIEASHGRTFFLFTSYKALQYAATWLAEKIEFPLLIQGDAPKTELIKNFCQLGNAVLLGTSSFWEGVDVRGRVLSLVIIDKLPFVSPGDPILQARNVALKKQGKNPFYDFQLPNAVIDLKQGAGRLIRDVTDRGVLVIGDPRLVGRDYGEYFFKALPAMKRTRELQCAIDFIKADELIHETLSH